MESVETEIVGGADKRDQRGRRITTAEERERVLAVYDASGLTQKAFARREGLNYDTLVAWLARRRREARGHTVAPSTTPVRFREFALEGKSSSTASLEVCLPSGIVVRGSSAAQLVELIQALQGA